MRPPSARQLVAVEIIVLALSPSLIRVPTRDASLRARLQVPRQSAKLAPRALGLRHCCKHQLQVLQVNVFLAWIPTFGTRKVCQTPHSSAAAMRRFPWHGLQELSIDGQISAEEHMARRSAHRAEPSRGDMTGFEFRATEAWRHSGGAASRAARPCFPVRLP
jgi:hypothetical protein